MDPRRVLVIDDNVHSAETLAVILRHWGYEVRVAFGGEEGLAAADEFRPETVLLDFRMPEMDGFEVARRLRTQPDQAATFIILLSGDHPSDLTGGECEPDYDRFLSKPVNLGVLQRWLAREADRTVLQPRTARS
jgi:CheY-like chemotaxis protein